MMRMTMVVAVLVAGLAGAEEAALAPTPAPVPSAGQAWSVVGARTVGENRNAVEVGVGFPAVYGAFTHGLAPNFDLGAKASFTYGMEGMIDAVMPGMKLNVLARVRLLDTGKFSVAVVAEPGPLLSFQNNSYQVGLAIPVGVHVGIVPSSAVTIGVSFDLPFWINFGPNGRFMPYAGANVPILTGLGVEYFVKSDMLLFFRVKMGPTLSNYYTAHFTLDATMGLGFKF